MASSREANVAIRVLIVDDETLARQRLRRLVQAEPDASVVGECRDGREAVDAIRAARPDLVLLDVQMPELDGFGVLQALRGEQTPRVVFVTAYDEHAIRAFDVHAVDYVLKPVDADRFRLAFDRARQSYAHAAAADQLGQLLETVRRVSHGEGGSAADSALTPPGGQPAVGALQSTAASTTPAFASRILVKDDGRMFFVKVTDIDWIEADRNYVRLHVGASTHTIRDRISRLEDTLDPRVFARIHRSTIVNLNRIQEMQQWFSGDYVVILQNGTRLRLSRHYREQVERQVGAG
jgi:two-component system, LytTR family, response regulator